LKVREADLLPQAKLLAVKSFSVDLDKDSIYRKMHFVAVKTMWMMERSGERKAHFHCVLFTGTVPNESKKEKA
jgi:hypothetical protein